MTSCRPLFKSWCNRPTGCATVNWTTRARASRTTTALAYDAPWMATRCFGSQPESELESKPKESEHSTASDAAPSRVGRPSQDWGARRSVRYGWNRGWDKPWDWAWEDDQRPRLDPLTGQMPLSDSIQYRLIEPSGEEVSSSAGHEVICSYSWSVDDPSLIYAPGHPPIYTPQDLPVEITQLSVSAPLQLAAPNIDLGVVFQATEIVNPEFRFDHVDLIIDRGTLKLLFNRCYDDFTDVEFWERHLDVKLVQNTLIIERRPTRVPQTNGYRAGLRFEQAFTRPPANLPDNGTHLRLIKYRLGNLVCAVRFQVDGCYHDDSDNNQFDPPQTGTNNEGRISYQTGIRAIRRGVATPSSEIIEFKVRHNRGTPYNSFHAAAQLWLGRSADLISGLISNGAVQSLATSDLAKDIFPRWETGTNVQRSLRRLVALISWLRDTARAAGGKPSLAVVRGQFMDIYTDTAATKSLPNDIVTRFWSGREGQDKEFV